MFLNEKKISIVGKNNRYQMKKVLKKNEPTMKKGADNMDVDFYDFNYQQKMLYDETSECFHSMLKHIGKKIESYKHQDNLKNRIIGVSLTSRDIVELMKESMCCYYCKEKMLILYKMKREMKQWTLDRIDNDLAHDKSNVVLACLKCNMERRCKSKDNFFFTKQLILTKMES